MLPNNPLDTVIIHLINTTPNAGATTLKNAMAARAENAFHVPPLQKNFLAESVSQLHAYQKILGEKEKTYLEADDQLDHDFQHDEKSLFCIGIFSHDGQLLQAKIWDDTEAAKFDNHYTKEVPDAQLFLVDLTCADEERQQIEAMLKVTNRRTAPNTIRLLVGNKADEVKDTLDANSIEALAEKYEFDHAIISATSPSDVAELMQEVFAAVFRLRQQLPSQPAKTTETTVEKHAREQEHFRSQLMEKALTKLNATHTRFFGEATVQQKRNGLNQLIEKLSQDKEQSIAEIIATVRKEFPAIDNGIFSSQTHELLEGFIKEEKDFVTKSPGRRHG